MDMLVRVGCSLLIAITVSFAAAWLWANSELHTQAAQKRVEHNSTPRRSTTGQGLGQLVLCCNLKFSPLIQPMVNT